MEQVLSGNQDYCNLDRENNSAFEMSCSSRVSFLTIKIL